ncbi:uncharacterized protein BDR25DRAFT_90001 [Lindgomyces ingoldianus]|uniref:Uncharacterized protein n=1 Tax=Lindgomyces ingoldianus TaxID=673940 RepID=A0ACB6RA64_9PLEO|nr:uncharacterized protein BDR25DRAFT_90001 [Lindgomyces ingoldianus]KAF2476036.1 hypothetical protein BDR25DRAFT_90001 [Lindgomyces ingoldianus]
MSASLSARIHREYNIRLAPRSTTLLVALQWSSRHRVYYRDDLQSRLVLCVPHILYIDLSSNFSSRQVRGRSSIWASHFGRTHPARVIPQFLFPTRWLSPIGCALLLLSCSPSPLDHMTAYYPCPSATVPLASLSCPLSTSRRQDTAGHRRGTCPPM